MEYNCPNCHHAITQNFCANCGQKKYKRIDKKYIWEELQYTILHTNKGFLYSIKNIVKNPGKTAKEFIDGNRVNHYKPILLAFVLSGISTFVSFKIIGLKELMSSYYAQQHMNSQFMNDYVTFTSSYNSVIMLALIPLFALLTKIALRKWGHNYFEHIVMNAYILSFYTLLNIFILYPIMYFFRNRQDVIIPVTSLSMSLIPFILTWFFKGFYADKSLKSIIGRVLLIILLLFLSFLISIILVVIGGVIFAMIKGPDALEYLKAK